MKYDLSSATFIIPIRIESVDRLRNIITVVAFLLENFNTNVLIKEVDTQSVFKKEALPILKEVLDFDFNIKHIFEKSNSSSFHRQRIINEMIIESKTKIIVNYDCDVILPIDSYMDAYQLILNNESDVVYPYGQGSYQKQVFATDEIVSGFLESGDYSYLDNNSKSYLSDFGWVQFFNRDVYIEGGMENENFVAYAPEDKERFYRFTKLGYRIKRIDNVVYHLEHSRGQNSWLNNPHMSSNNQLWEDLQKLDREHLKEYYLNQDYLKKYNGQK
jgi:hypothetical protein